MSVPGKVFIGRRRLLAMAISSTFCLVSCANQQVRSEPIAVDTTGVKDVRDLVRAIKTAGGQLLPKSTNDDFILVAMAKTFVDNARDAIERHGVKIPSWIVDRLPNKKVSWDKPDRTDAVVFLTILGVVFVLPQLIFFSLLLASILLMTNYIAEELRKLTVKKT